MIGNKIKQLRQERGLTQNELAKALGVSAAAIGNYEQGIRFPSAALVSKIADFFNVYVEYLMSDDANSSTDIEKYMDTLAADLLSADGLMFDGKPLDKESINKVVDAMRVGMRIALENENRKNNN